MKKLIGLLALIIILACSGKDKITDLIQPLHIKAGISDTISVQDLFYVSDYDRVSFKHAPDLKIIYLPVEKKLILKPRNDFSGLTYVGFSYNEQDYQIPVYVKYRVRYTFNYSPKENEKNIVVIGQFNTWNRNSPVMTDENNDGILERTIWLEPGRYEYKFYSEGNEFIDPENPKTIPNPFGALNSILEISDPYASKPTLRNKGFIKKENEITLDFFIENLPAATNPEFMILIDNSMLPQDAYTFKDNILSVKINTQKLAASFTLQAAVKAEKNSGLLKEVRFINGDPSGGPDHDFLWSDAIIYSIMIDRFYDGNPLNSQRINNPQLSEKMNFMGGDLQGITKKLEEGYFDKLGVNVFWLSPVYQNPWRAYQEWPQPKRYVSGYHGYWPIDPQKVDERFGTMENLKTFIQKAHQKGYKVILDFVSNHVHEEHPWYKENPDWFGDLDLPDGRKNIRFFDEHRLTTWFDTFLPSFDFEGSPEAIDAVTDNAVWWLKESGADGFRQDAVKHVPNTFWRELTRKIHTEIEIPEKRRVFQIGETFGGYDLVSSYVNNGQLDAQFNFNLYDVAHYTFLNDDVSFKELDNALKKTFSVYGMNNLMGNLIDSHDKVRFAAMAENDIPVGANTTEIGFTNPPQINDLDTYNKIRSYLVYLLTVPGVPIVYYGLEIGMTGAADPDNRRMMRFGEELTTSEKNLLEEARRIINLRKNNSALRYGDFETLYTDENLYAFLRSDMRQRILVVINKSSVSQILNVDLDAKYKISSLVPLYGVKRFLYDGKSLNSNIDAYSGQVYLLK